MHYFASFLHCTIKPLIEYVLGFLECCYNGLKMRKTFFLQMVWWINKHKHSITNVSIFRVVSFNAFCKFSWLGNSAWNFWGLNFGPGIFLGFDFCPHSIIPVTWNPEYPTWFLPHLNNHSQPTYEITPGFKPFILNVPSCCVYFV